MSGERRINLDRFCRLYPTTSMPALAEQFGISEARVKQIARDHKLKRTPQPKATATATVRPKVSTARSVMVIPSRGGGWGTRTIHRIADR